ncbi:hypothetical protein [Methylobacterium sp. ID0610]
MCGIAQTSVGVGRALASRARGVYGRAWALGRRRPAHRRLACSTP